MNWDAIGAIGEVVGAFAVVLTLAYLALQIRQNTKSVQSSALDAAITTMIATRQSIGESLELTNTFNRGMRDPESLDEDELLRFRIGVQNALWGIWNVYAQAEISGMSRGVWEAQKPLVERLLSPPGGIWFWSTYKQEFEETFIAEIERILVRTV